MRNVTFMLLISVLCIMACKTEPTPPKVVKIDYPETKKIDHVDTYHGVEVPDPYRWLEDDRSEETGEWVKAQNNVTFGLLDQINFRDPLKKRIEQLMDYERVSAPFEEGNYEYFYKNDGLQDHAVVYRTKIGDDKAEPTIFLNPNTFSEDGTIALRGMSFTQDGSMAAYMITEGGSDWRKIIVLDVETMEIKEDTLKDVKF